MLTAVDCIIRKCELTALVIPIPVSRMVRVLFSLSGMMSIRRSLPESSLLGSERDSYRILSRASEAVGDEFSQEDLLVGVNCVDDQGEKLAISA